MDIMKIKEILRGKKNNKEKTFLMNGDFKLNEEELKTAQEIYLEVINNIKIKTKKITGFKRLNNRTKEIFVKSLVEKEIKSNWAKGGDGVREDWTETEKGIENNIYIAIKKSVEKDFQTSLSNLKREEILEIKKDVEGRREELKKSIEKIGTDKYESDRNRYSRFLEILEGELKNRSRNN